MAILPILVYPDPRLAQACLPVTSFDGELKQLAQDLVETMQAAPGVGITGAHVGRLQRVVVLRLEGDAAPSIYVNPEMLEATGPVVRHVEGSVSMPGITEEVERPGHIRFSYVDLAGQRHEAEADGFRAICLQHEIDQLDGMFWLRRLSRLKRERCIKRWDKLRLSR